MKKQQPGHKMQKTCPVCIGAWCAAWFAVSGDILFTSTRQIWASSKPSPLIGGELILVESPQEGAETCHFLLELGARDWLGEVKAWSLIWQDKRRMVQEALKDV